MRSPRAALFCLLSAFAATMSAVSGAVTFSVLAKLGAQPNGYTPSVLVVGSDHNFYGTTQYGGTSGDGTVFKLTPSGTLTTLYSFTGGNDGANPMGPLVVGTDGNLYGTTGEYSTPTGAGTFFKITTAGVFTTLHTFNGTTEGGAPTQVTVGPDGNFYAAPAEAGTSQADGGALLQIIPAGVVTVLHTFNAATEGAYLNPQLVVGSDGALYGTASSGGANGTGTIFRATTTGSVSILAGLNGSADLPVLITTLGNDGYLYGVDPNANTIFKMTNAGVRTTVYIFTKQDDGSDPVDIIQGSDGNFYGTSAGYGVNGYGTFFKISSGGSFQELYAFPSTIGGDGASGEGVEGLAEGADGNYYVSTPLGGPAFAGTILQLTPSGTEQTIYSFTEPGSYPMAALLQASDGNFYGTTEYGGATDDGTVYQVTATGTLTQLASFNFATTGSRPISPLVQDPSTGTFYGTCSKGGADYANSQFPGGTIYSGVLQGTGPQARSGFRPADAAGFEMLLDIYTNFLDGTPDIFDGLEGMVAQAALFGYHFGQISGGARKALASPTDTSSSPTFYFFSASGGDNNEGAFLEAANTGTLTVLYSFGNQTADGAGPEAAPATDSAGNIYSTTSAGGTSGLGTIFKITPSSGSTNSTLTTLHSFTAATGSSPGTNNLVIGTDGNIYGTTTAGGSNGTGVVFQMTPSGTYKVLHSFGSVTSPVATNGTVPAAGLVEGTDHNFYGTTEQGGTYNVGTVYSISSTGAFSVLHSFNGHDGFQPRAALIEASDGNLYGVTTGNSFNNGVIFKIDAGLPPPTTSGTTAQTITFPSIAAQTVGASVTLGATASSGLAVSYTVSGPATLSGSTLTFTALGTVKVTASQAGNSTYAAATPVVQSITVGKGAQTITFPAQADGTYGVPYTITAPTASSGLPVTVKVLSGSAKLSGQTLTFAGAGDVVLAANQAGNASYAAATQVTTTIVVNKGAQTIAAFAAIPTHHENDAPFVVTAPKASSGLVVTVTVLSGPATIVSGKVTLNGTGTVTLAANQAGNVDYNAAPQVTTTFSVEAASQTIAKFATIPAKTTTSAPFTITPPKASSGLAVTVSVASGPASISGDTVTVTGAGSVTLEATQAGNSDFTAATPVTTTFMVNGSPQTIAAFTTIPAHTFGDAPFAVTPPVASSGLAVALSVKSGPATISSGMVTLTGAGTVVLAADQAGNSDFNPAKEVTTSFVVKKAAQTIAPFAAIADKTYGAAPFDLTPPTASSSLPTVVTVKSGPAKITGDLVTLTGVGTVTLSAAQTGNANYNAAPPVTTTFTVSKGTQTIAAFPSFATQMYNGALTLTAPAASSGLPVTLKVLSGPGKLAGTKLTFTGVGTVMIAANQAGTTDVAAAPQVTASITVDPATQTIAAFAPITARVYGAPPFAVTPPVASSKLPVVLSVLSGPATITGTKVTLTGAGTVVLAANQAGNADYDAAAQVTASFVIAKAAQTIKPFAKITGKTTTSPPFTITLPTSSSGLPVTVAVQSGPATLSGNTVTVTGSGTVVLAAAQAGNDDYNAATTVTTSFTVP